MVSAVSLIDYHQRRGAAWDIIDEAILAYDQYMLDDDYDAHRVLREIMSRMKERRDLYQSTTAAPAALGTEEN